MNFMNTIKATAVAATLATGSVQASALEELANANMSDLEMGVTYDEVSKTVTWIGPITEIPMYKFRVLYEDLDIETIRFRSNGGITEYGFALGELVKKRNIAVEVAKICDSACTLIALESKKLTGSKNGSLGFHLSYIRQLGPGDADTNTFHYQVSVANNQSINKFIVDKLRKSPYLTNEQVDKIVNETSPDTIFEVPVSVLLETYNKKVDIY